jgi:hypothetical protein
MEKVFYYVVAWSVDVVLAGWFCIFLHDDEGSEWKFSAKP